VKKVERQSASAYFTWDISWTLCNASNVLLSGQVYLMLMSSVPHARSTLDRKRTLFKLIVNFFLKGIVFMFWHDIVYIELLYCVTNFELVQTWNKVAVAEHAKTCELYPTFLCTFLVTAPAPTLTLQQVWAECTCFRNVCPQRPPLFWTSPPHSEGEGNCR